MCLKFWTRDKNQSKPPLRIQIKHYYHHLTSHPRQQSLSAPMVSGTKGPSVDLTDGMNKTSPKKTVSGKPCIIMPLYIYPLTGKDSWKPLYDAISSNPHIDFIVIVNPNSGPGDQPLPGADYEREVPKLNAFPNVRTVGYIAVTWADKAAEKAQEEIRRYAGWDADHDNEGLYVEGIYVDETPNHAYDHCTRYLEELGRYIKGCKGLLGERLVIHNPGCPPEGPLSAFGSPDIVCVSEEPYHKFCSAEVQSRVRTYQTEYDRTFFQISGVPLAEIREAAEGMLFDLSRGNKYHGNGGTNSDDGKERRRKPRGRYIFVTDLKDDFYESFGESWPVFVDAIGEFGREEVFGGSPQQPAECEKGGAVVVETAGSQ